MRNKTARILANYRFDTTNEDCLQRGIAAALTAEDIPYKREVVLAKTDRIDFLLEDGCGVEVKTAGAPTAVLRQLYRYAANDQVTSLLLVTTRPQHNSLPDVIDGKPLRTLVLYQSLI